MNFARFIGALIIVMVVSVLMVPAVGFTAATIFSMGGTLSVLTFSLAQIIFIDSRKSWPGLTAAQRLGYLITFSSPRR
jgi:uncharacterized membrane protein